MTFNWSWIRALQKLGLTVLFLVILGPLLALIIQMMPTLLAGHGDWLALAIPTGRRLFLLLNSLKFAAAVAIGGVVLGTSGRPDFMALGYGLAVLRALAGDTAGAHTAVHSRADMEFIDICR